MEDNFRDKTSQQVERLSHLTLQEIEREVAQKRIAWCKENLPQAGSKPDITPRAAFERLFFDYMGLARDDLPIVRESPTEIAWLSRNPCPTLSACQEMGLDTRRVCRGAYEKSTQAFISQIDPQLRFMRSYQEIRPHAGHCLEWIMRVDFERMVGLAIDEALAGKEEGYSTGGAIMLLGKDILGLAHDTSTGTERDPNLHADAHVIYQGVQTAADSNLCGAILFTTREPCAHCADLAIRANITTIVYGISIAERPLSSALVDATGAQAVIARSPAMVESISGVLADRCRALYD
jgi:tRNA(Arg) A34 adenosine deaminase TadA